MIRAVHALQSLADSISETAARSLTWVVLALAVLGVSCPQSATGQAMPPSRQADTAIFAGRLVTVEAAGQSYRSGPSLWMLRSTAAVRLPFGVLAAGRADVTSTSQIDPGSLDLSAARAIEATGAVSWSPLSAGPVTLGAAAVVGTVVAASTAATWSTKNTLGGGFRVGYGRSYAYALVGSHGAADATAGAASARLMLAGQLEWKRFAAFGDYVSGPGGWGRAGVLFRVPIP